METTNNYYNDQFLNNHNIVVSLLHFHVTLHHIFPKFNTYTRKLYKVVTDTAWVNARHYLIQ